MRHWWRITSFVRLPFRADSDTGASEGAIPKPYLVEIAALLLYI
jgi:hypothetical protein